MQSLLRVFFPAKDRWFAFFVKQRFFVPMQAYFMGAAGQKQRKSFSPRVFFSEKQMFWYYGQKKAAIMEQWRKKQRKVKG